MAEYKQLKLYFDRELAKDLAQKISKVYKKFPSKTFIQNTSKVIGDLELKQRVNCFSEELYKSLPSDYLKALKILENILGPELTTETGMFKQGYWLMPIAHYVEKFGLEYFKESMDFIEKLTSRHTGEFCIRPFIFQNPERVLKRLKKWSKDKNVHIRRLSSEAMRPRLPWAKKFAYYIEEPRPIFDLLSTLKGDDSLFVRKSVANHMGDYVKENPKAAFVELRKWKKDNCSQIQWVIKHALRYEIKKKNPEAMKLIS